MDLKLNPATKKAFFNIDSSNGIIDIAHLFEKFMQNSGPIAMRDFAELVARDKEEVLKLVQSKGEINANGDLVALLGLSIVPTKHELVMAGRKFYTWCAADSLIFPAILDEDAVIHSKDPINDENIEIKISGDQLVEVTPEGAMISWIDEIDEDDIRCSMCNRVHFFASHETAASWHENNQDARILPVVDYYTLGVEVNN